MWKKELNILPYILPVFLQLHHTLSCAFRKPEISFILFVTTSMTGGSSYGNSSVFVYIAFLFLTSQVKSLFLLLGNVFVTIYYKFPDICAKLCLIIYFNVCWWSLRALKFFNGVKTISFLKKIHLDLY